MSNEAASAYFAVALFAGTALASQLLQEKLRRKREVYERDLRQAYRSRRAAGRLSYDDLNHFLFDEERGRQNLPSKSSLRPRLANRRSDRQLLSQTSMASAGTLSQNEDAFDFHPKNSNWCHFERGSDDSSMRDDFDECSSSSSEEAFLWTQSTRTQNKRRKDDKIGWNLSRYVPYPLKSLTESFDSFLSSGADEGEEDNTTLDMSYAGDEADATLATGTGPLGRRTALPPPPSSGLGRRSTSMPQLHSPDQNPQSHQSRMQYPILPLPEEHPHVDIAQQNRAARAQYNACIMPNKVVMVRHGQSQGNVDERLYSTTPDNAMRLTKLGWDQAYQAGRALKHRVVETGEPVHFIVSPYVRTVETFHGIVSAWCDPSEFDHIRDREKRVKAWYARLLELGLTWHEDPRIREQDFGNYQQPAKIRVYKKERRDFGPFYYRFPHGESASDVFDRVSTFLDSLWRSFDLNRSRNYVLVTHGIAIRVLLARYFRYSIDQFSLLANPKNCEMVILGHDGYGKLRLEGRAEPLYENDQSPDKQVIGYDFHPRLRVLPKEHVHKVPVRISADDDVEKAQQGRNGNQTPLETIPSPVSEPTLPSLLDPITDEKRPKRSTHRNGMSSYATSGAS